MQCKPQMQYLDCPFKCGPDCEENIQVHTDCKKKHPQNSICLFHLPLDYLPLSFRAPQLATAVCGYYQSHSSARLYRGERGVVASIFKDHRQRIPRFVIGRYLEKNQYRRNSFAIYNHYK